MRLNEGKKLSGGGGGGAGICRKAEVQAAAWRLIRNQGSDSDRLMCVMAVARQRNQPRIIDSDQECRMINFWQGELAVISNCTQN